jgi:O-antigen/teichoic acid export membrane protein
VVDRAVTAGGWAFLGRAVGRVSGFIRTIVLAHLLSPSDFGLMGTALVLLSTVETFTGTGFETALVQRRQHVERFYDTAFAVHVVRGVALAAVFWGAAPAAASFFGGPALIPVLRAVGLVPLFRGCANPARLRFVRHLQYEALFWWGLPEILVNLGLAIALGFRLRSVWALVIPVVASQAVATVVSHLMVGRMPRFALNWGRFQEIARYGKWVLAAQVMTFLSQQGDNAFIAKVLGMTPLGYYQVASRVAEVPVTGFSQVVGEVALPSLSALHADRDRLRDWYFTAQRAVLTAHGLFLVPVLLLGAPLTRRLLGARWMPIVPTLKILAVAMVLRSVVTVGGTLFNALGVPRIGYQVTAVRALLMAAAIYPFAHVLGLEGVAIAVLIGVVGATLFYARTLHATLGIDWQSHVRYLVSRRV